MRAPQIFHLGDSKSMAAPGIVDREFGTNTQRHLTIKVRFSSLTWAGTD